MGHPTGVIRSIEVSADGSFALRGKTYTNVLALVANTAKALTVPTFATAAGGTSPATHVAFSSNGPFWANYDIALAAVPSADVTDGRAPELSPAVRLITDVTTINLIAPANTLVSAMFYQG